MRNVYSNIVPIFYLGYLSFCYGIRNIAGCWWLTPVILATAKAEIRRIVV
jgi:hypothetical protein